MGFLSSLFGGTPSRSPEVVKFAGAMVAYIRTINIMFMTDPLENQMQDPHKRKLIISFLLGSADFLGRHVQSLPSATVLAGFTAALEMELGMSPSQAEKACNDAVSWFDDHDHKLYVQQGAMASANFMADDAPASKPLRIMLGFSDPADLRQFLENGADFDGLTRRSRSKS
jgi:hypothetical protein